MSSVPPSQLGDASRVALARLALDVVSTVPGVAGTDAGPGGVCVTADPPFGLLQGVTVIAQPDGRYEVNLCLVARMVPLLSLGDEIRRQLSARASRAGLAGLLGTVNVEFAQALGPGETLQEVPGPEVAVGAEAPGVVAGSPSSAPLSTGPPPPTTPPPRTASPGPPAVPEEPTGSISPRISPPDPAGSPIPPPGSPHPSPPPDREPGS